MFRGEGRVSRFGGLNGRRRLGRTLQAREARRRRWDFAYQMTNFGAFWALVYLYALIAEEILHFYRMLGATKCNLCDNVALVVFGGANFGGFSEILGANFQRLAA